MARAFRSLLGNRSPSPFSSFLLQLEELKEEITKEQQNTVNLRRDLEEKCVNEIVALKESHQDEIAELESRLRGKHEAGIALLERQYQVGAMMFMTHTVEVDGGMVLYCSGKFICLCLAYSVQGTVQVNSLQYEHYRIEASLKFNDFRHAIITYVPPILPPPLKNFFAVYICTRQ